MTQHTHQHDEQVRDYFDRSVANYDAFYEARSGFERLFNRLFRKAVFARCNQTIALAKRFGCKTVLDVGCGSGRNSITFVMNGVDHVYGIDTSPEMIEEAKELAKQAGVADKCTFEHGDFMSMNIEGKYDLAAALGVFDYVLDSGPFLKRMSELANKVIYGSFPGYTLLRSPLRKLRYSLRGCPTHFYREPEIRKIFDDTQFGVFESLWIGGGYLAWAAKQDG